MRVRAARLVAVAGLLGVALSPVGGRSWAGAVEGSPDVSLSATTQITDGQVVTVTVRTVEAAPTYRAEARLCRGGVAYQGSTGNRPNADFESNGPNCPGPSNPISTSADSSVTDTNTYANAPTPDGESFLFRLGSGVAAWTDVTTGAPTTLTCDATHPCALVVELLYSPAQGAPAQWKPFVSPISYGVDDPIAGCGGPANDVLATGGSDRLSEAWVAWTLAACRLEGANGAPTRASFLGEGNAVSSFATGKLDVAYTAGGYDDAIGLLDREHSGLGDAAPRSAVAIPVAVNAAVLAIGGGVRVDESHKVPYKDIKLTVPEVAAMVGGGPTVVGNAPYADDIKNRNSELFQTDLFDTAAGFQIGAYADAEASSWYATRWLEALAPDAWKVPDVPTFSERGQPRTVDASLARARPSYAEQITLLSGRPALRKGLIGPGTTTQGGVWVLTDAQTAKALGLTTVQIQDARGAFVAPTPATLLAALPAMSADDQGILISDPSTAPAGAYPMTFVEYVLAPAEPLLADDCSPRTASQRLMTDWLSYITTDGQAALPTGLTALPAGLEAEAAAAIKKVGTAPISGTCAAAAGPAVPTELPTVAPPALAPGRFPASAPNLGFPSLSTTALGADISPAHPVQAVELRASSKPIAELADIPPFAGRRGVGWLGIALALVGIIGLASAALVVTTRTR